MTEPDYWPQLITGGAGLLGSIIGAAAATSAQLFMKRSERRDARRSLAFGMASEVESYIELMERRNHVRAAEEIVKRLRNGEDMHMPNFADHPQSNKEYFPFFKANLTSLGILGGPICKSLATFHREIDAVRSTAEAANRGEFEHFSRLEKADVIEGELEIFRGAMNRGKHLVLQLYAV